MKKTKRYLAGFLTLLMVLGSINVNAMNDSNLNQNSEIVVEAETDTSEETEIISSNENDIIEEVNLSNVEETVSNENTEDITAENIDVNETEVKQENETEEVNETVLNDENKEDSEKTEETSTEIKNDTLEQTEANITTDNFDEEVEEESALDENIVLASDENDGIEVPNKPSTYDIYPDFPNSIELQDVDVYINCSNTNKHSTSVKLSKNIEGCIFSDIRKNEGELGTGHNTLLKKYPYACTLTLKNEYFVNLFNDIMENNNVNCAKHMLDTKTGIVSMVLLWNSEDNCWNYDEEFLYMYVTEVEEAPITPTITGITKEIITSEEDIKNLDFYDETASIDNIYYPQEKVIFSEENPEVRLLYKITVAGEEGAKYEVTDDGCDFISNNKTGIINETGKVEIYVVKHFTKNDIENGYLKNIAYINESQPSNEVLVEAEVEENDMPYFLQIVLVNYEKTNFEYKQKIPSDSVNRIWYFNNRVIIEGYELKGWQSSRYHGTNNFLTKSWWPIFGNSSIGTRLYVSNPSDVNYTVHLEDGDGVYLIYQRKEPETINYNYSLTWDYNGGKVGNDSIRTKNETSNDNTYTFYEDALGFGNPKPQKEGYTFQGWSYSGNGKFNSLNGQIVMNGLPDETVSGTLTAIWKTVDNGNGISIEKIRNAINGDEELTEAEAGDVITYDIVVTNNSNVQKTVTLTEMLYGATLNQTQVIVEPGKSETVTATYTVTGNEQLKNGFLYNTVKGETNKLEEMVEDTDDGTILKIFTVTYTDGVEKEIIFRDQNYEELKEGDITPGFTGTPTRNGYEFVGWKLISVTPNKEGIQPMVKAEDTDRNNEIIYEAQWKKKTETIKPNAEFTLKKVFVGLDEIPKDFYLSYNVTCGEVGVNGKLDLNNCNSIDEKTMTITWKVPYFYDMGNTNNVTITENNYQVDNYTCSVKVSTGSVNGNVINFTVNALASSITRTITNTYEEVSQEIETSYTVSRKYYVNDMEIGTTSVNKDGNVGEKVIGDELASSNPNWAKKKYGEEMLTFEYKSSNPKILTLTNNPSENTIVLEYYFYTEDFNQITVTWIDEDKKTILDGPKTFTKGEDEPPYEKDLPTKQEDEYYTYEFIGWEEPVIDDEGNIIYYAKYKPTPKKLIVSWYDEDKTTYLDTNTFLKTENEPSYSKELPTKEEDEKYTYVFKEWILQETPLNDDDISYVASYTPIPKKYNYTIKHQYYTDGKLDGTEIVSDTLELDEILKSSDIEKQETYKDNIYQFSNVDKEKLVITSSEEDNVITFRYDRFTYKVIHKYLDSDGNLVDSLEESFYAFIGAEIKFDSISKKPIHNGKTYDYISDSGNLIISDAVDSNTIEIVYQLPKPKETSYLVQWLDTNGNELKSEKRNGFVNEKVKPEEKDYILSNYSFIENYKDNILSTILKEDVSENVLKLYFTKDSEKETFGSYVVKHEYYICDKYGKLILEGTVTDKIVSVLAGTEINTSSLKKIPVYNMMEYKFLEVSNNVTIEEDKISEIVMKYVREEFGSYEVEHQYYTRNENGNLKLEGSLKEMISNIKVGTSIGLSNTDIIINQKLNYLNYKYEFLSASDNMIIQKDLASTFIIKYVRDIPKEEEKTPPKKDETPSKNEETKTEEIVVLPDEKTPLATENVQTGDTTPLVVLFGLLVISSIGILLFRKRK